MATLAQNIQRAINDFNSIENAIVQKGVPVPDGTPTSEYGEKILSIESGVDTSGDTVIPSALREGYTAHDAAGQKITGTIPDYSGDNTVEMTSPDGSTLNTAGTYCEGNIEVVPKLQSKTATTGEIVTADDGYVGLESVDTNPVFEAGKKSEYDAFWDAYQGMGARKNYTYAFSSAGWTGSVFKPKYDIIPTTVRGFFWNGGLNGVDFAEKMSSSGVKFDSSQVTAYDGFYQFCYYGSPSRLPVISTVGCETLTQFMEYATVVTIDKLVLKEDGTQTFSNSFRGCASLRNLIVEGTIGKSGLNFSWSPLSKASLTSIVNALSYTTTGLPVTLRLAAVNTEFETSAGAADGSNSEEWLALASTKPNWNISLINS